ncbi:MAG: hypothetical protein V4473_01710 [Patescibacteria group bacterium]
MTTSIKIILLTLIILVAGFVAAKSNSVKKIIPVKTDLSARTLYEGYVSIETVSLADIKTKLETQGCHDMKYTGGAASRCKYSDGVSKLFNQKSLEIYPNGLGFGPNSFYITENKLWADQDISGKPDMEKYKAGVRKYVTEIKNIVTIKENTWKITRSEYPWNVVY